MSVHILKITPKYYSDIIHGYKTFEIRNNDRDFKEGDELNLQEYDNGTYTGKSVEVKVIGVMRNYPGVHPDYVVMYIRKK